MTLSKDQAAYLICLSRGHQPEGLVIDTLPPFDTCKHCGTTFRYERKLVEARTPFGWRSDIERAGPTSEAYRIVVERLAPEDAK